jgi:hypothetical protein
MDDDPISVRVRYASANDVWGPWATWRNLREYYGDSSIVLLIEALRPARATLRATHGTMSQYQLVYAEIGRFDQITGEILDDVDVDA